MRWEEASVKESKHFCIMPWVHCHITQYGTVTPCCQTSWKEEDAFGNINKKSIAEIWNDSAIKDFRKKMIQDEPDDRCFRCYDKEKSGLYSLRKATNQDYLKHLNQVNSTNADGSSDGTAPVYFDIRFSNFCNFKCRICGPWSSSSWFQDARELGWVNEDIRLSKAIEDEDAFFKQFEHYLPQVEEIYFAGGEPLLMEQHYRVLDLLLNMGLTKTYLRYNTNFSTFEYRGKSIFDYWKQFDNIFLCASLDGAEKSGELQRSGQVWVNVKENRKKLLRECPHIDFMLAPTVSVLSALQLPEFHRNWVEEGLIDVSEIFPSLLEEPKEYNIKLLPTELKHRLEQKYTAHVEWILHQPSKDEAVKKIVANEFLNCIKYMWAEDLSSSIPSFKALTQQLDNIRKEKTVVVLHELKSILE